MPDKAVKVIEKLKPTDVNEEGLCAETSFKHFSSLIEEIIKDAYKEVIGEEPPENGIFHLDIQ
jgi:hypothetical protein